MYRRIQRRCAPRASIGRTALILTAFSLGGVAACSQDASRGDAETSLDPTVTTKPTASEDGEPMSEGSSSVSAPPATAPTADPEMGGPLEEPVDPAPSGDQPTTPPGVISEQPAEPVPMVPPAPAAGGAPDPGRQTPDAGGAGGAASGAAGSGGEPVEPGEPMVRMVGRYVDAGGNAVSFEWSGSGVVAAFEGTNVHVTLEDGGSNQFTLLVDGQLMPTLTLQAGIGDYELASGLEAGEHVVELYRRTEASFGTTTFHGFDFGPNGRLLVPPAAPSRRIEIIGDSISCGYGNEGSSASCSFSADTENHYATYGAIAARALGAEVVTIAWSGKGVVYNYDTDTNDPLPALYDRALPSDASSAWGFETAPDVVVINLGTNDFSTDGDPSPELFRAEYVEFLSHLRGVYPGAYILCTVGPLLGGADLDAARTGIDAAIAARTASGDMLLGSWQMDVPNDDPGCDYHPGLATHQVMADALVTELRTRLGW